MSEGTLKGLVLNMLINMPMGETGSLLAIDEPETNLHPAWQKVVGHWILNSGNYKQFFVSTHSPDFLDVFTDEFKQGNVAVFVFADSERIKKIQYQDIAGELGDWELGDLYRTNDPALGGDGSYVKLSDQIINAVQTGVKDAISSLSGSNQEYVDQIVASKQLYYSKSRHGDYMLRNIQPDNVEKKCRRYFQKAYSEMMSLLCDKTK